MIVGSTPHGARPASLELHVRRQVVKPGLFGIRHHLIQSRGPGPPGPLVIRQHVRQAHPSVAPWLLEGDLARLEQSHERRPRNPEYLGGLARRQDHLMGSDSDRQPLGQRLDHVAKDHEDLRRQVQPLAVRTDQRRTLYAPAVRAASTPPSRPRSSGGSTARSTSGIAIPSGWHETNETKGCV